MECILRVNLLRPIPRNNVLDMSKSDKRGSPPCFLSKHIICQKWRWIIGWLLHKPSKSLHWTERQSTQFPLNAKCIYSLSDTQHCHFSHFINKIALNMHFQIQREGFPKLEIIVHCWTIQLGTLKAFFISLVFPNTVTTFIETHTSQDKQRSYQTQ